MYMIQGLEDFKTYNKAMEVGEIVWQEVAKWSFLILRRVSRLGDSAKTTEAKHDELE